MKHFPPIFVWVAISSLLMILPLSAQEPIVLQPNDSITFCGDSGPIDKLVGSYLAACQRAQYSVQAVPGGSLTDVLEAPAGQVKKAPSVGDLVQYSTPKVVVLCYGTRAGERQKSNPALLDKYRDELTQAVQKFKAAGARLVVLTSPMALDPDAIKTLGFPISYEDYSQTIADLDKVTKEVAANQKASYADLLTPMADTMKKAKAALGPTLMLTGVDVVYPTHNAAPILAYALLKAFKVDGNIGEITYDLANGTATASDGQKIISADKTKLEIESTRYPFCFGRDPGDPNDLKSDACILPFTPFNEELNRYILKVKNVPEGKWTVTWGGGSREFTAEQLKNGINLAAEFIVNPFTIPMEKVSGDIWDRQVFLSSVMAPLLFEADAIGATNASAKAACENLTKAVNSQWDAIKSAPTPAPVRHVITLTPANS